MPAKKTAKKTKDFKAMFEELREINRWFEDEDIDLDEGLMKLKVGKELIEQCKAKLVEVENEFEELTKEIEEEATEEASVDLDSVSQPVTKVKKELPF